MVKFRPSGRFVNLGAWADRASSGRNRTPFYAFVFEFDGGGGVRSCMGPGFRRGTFGSVDNKASSILVTFNKTNLNFGC
jgi:hypothetical protein